MRAKSLTVSAPSRLHFGLLSIGNVTKRRFGGAGLMINAPRTTVSISDSAEFVLEVSDDSRTACMEAVQNWQTHFATTQHRNLDMTMLPVKLRVEAAPRHFGLGSGTQLSFAIVVALQAAFDQAVPSTPELAMATGRGKRSAIGSYGFHTGGFLIDRGIAEEDIAPLELRLDFPEEWKIVLIEPRSESSESVFGDVEQKAFSDLPPTTQEEADSLAELLGSRVSSAMMGRDFDTFASAVTEYGYRSGLFYSPIQGGAYGSAAAAKVVWLVSEFGNYGVGQSSWGPLIFAICESEHAANCLVEYLGEHDEDIACQTTVTSADNQGVVIQTD